MGVFTDKKYDELDWISQAVEPIESPLNKFLAMLPDSIEISVHMLADHRGYYGNYSLEKDTIIMDYLKSNAEASEREKLTWEERSILERSFELVVDPETVIDMSTRTILSGGMRLNKVKSVLEDRDVEKTLGSRGLTHLGNIRWSRCNISNLNEILDLVGKCDDLLKGKSGRRKYFGLRSRLHQIFEKNEWNIKSIDLSNKVGIWVTDYLITGNLAALSNLTRLKVMTHKGVGIYSMEEVK